MWQPHDEMSSSIWQIKTEKERKETKLSSVIVKGSVIGKLELDMCLERMFYVSFLGQGVIVF